MPNKISFKLLTKSLYLFICSKYSNFQGAFVNNLFDDKENKHAKYYEYWKSNINEFLEELKNHYDEEIKIHSIVIKPTKFFKDTKTSSK